MATKPHSAARFSDVATSCEVTLLSPIQSGQSDIGGIGEASQAATIRQRRQIEAKGRARSEGEVDRRIAAGAEIERVFGAEVREGLQRDPGQSQGGDERDRRATERARSRWSGSWPPKRSRFRLCRLEAILLRLDPEPGHQAPDRHDHRMGRNKRRLALREQFQRSKSRDGEENAVLGDESGAAERPSGSRPCRYGS